MKKHLAFFLALLFLLTALAGCNKSGATEETTPAETTAQVPAEEQTTVPAPEVILPPAEEEEKSLTVVADGKSEYVILYPKNDAVCKAQAEQLQGWFEAAYGVTLPVAEDASVACAAEACEILIGATNRSESAQLYARVGRPQDYACCVIGNKIVLIGYDSAITQKAVNSFYGTYLATVRDVAKPLLVSASFERIVEGSYNIQLGYCAEMPLAKFNIIYPKDAIKGELYAVNLLRAHLYYEGKMKLTAKSDAGLATTKEIRIGAVNRTEKESAGEDEFVISVKNGNLYVVANDFYGYLAATKYLTETLFSPATPKDTLCEGFRYTGKVKDKIPEQTAEYRVMFYNVWCWGTAVRERDDHVVALVTGYSPDVVGFNEYSNQIMDAEGTIKNLLAKNGYGKAPAGNNGSGESVLFYKTATTTLIEDRYMELVHGNTAHIGVFESKLTGERYMAISVHFVDNIKDDTAETGSYYYSNGVRKRKEQVDSLMLLIHALTEKYGELPIIMGGDFNSPAVGRTMLGEKFVDACEHLVEKYGFEDSLDAATVSDYVESTHPYPIHDAVLGYFKPSGYYSDRTYVTAIDHIYQRGDAIDAQFYDTLDNDFTCAISDHFPVILDFNLK